MKYIFTATFAESSDGTFFARIPDLPSCITTGKDLSDAIDQITDAAGVWLVCAEDECLSIADPTPQSEIKTDLGMSVSLIRIDTDDYRSLTDSPSVCRNVPLPTWMAIQAEKKGINLSKVLQEDLLKRFES